MLLLGPYHFSPWLCHLFLKCSLGISNFLEETSSLSHFIVFLCLHWAFGKPFLFLLAILWNSTFIWIYLSFSSLPFTSLLFSAICKASSNNHFAFLHFFFLGMVWSPPPVQCYEFLSIVLQALYLSDLIPWIDLLLPLYNHKGFVLGHIWKV